MSAHFCTLSEVVDGIQAMCAQANSHFNEEDHIAIAALKGTKRPLLAPAKNTVYWLKLLNDIQGDVYKQRLLSPRSQAQPWQGLRIHRSS